jgi:predicted phosphodiesterase
MARVLAIGDTHFPACHPGYLSFCTDLASKHNVDTVVHIGDVNDVHAISNHDRDPEAKGALEEFEEAGKMVKRWYRRFPAALVCEGNHDARVCRMASTVGIPARFLKGYNELYKTPGWNWKGEHIIDDVYYTHGTGCGGAYPAFNIATKMLMSVVSGHVHSAAGIWWRANPLRRMFGMNLGCGVDDKHVAFKYGENLKVRSILSAGLVLDGTPLHFIMPCGPGEKYHRSRF